MRLVSIAHRIGFVFVLTLTAAGCGSSDESAERKHESLSTEDENDASLCATFCERLPTVCPAAHAEFKSANCEQTCRDAEDSSTEFRACMADANSCDDLRACKNAF